MVSGQNNNLAARTYQKQFAGLAQAVFGVKAVFGPTFGSLQALDGVQNNKTAFSVKTNNVPVVVGKYSTDANTAFGTGTGKSTRFGDRTEIIYEDLDVPYTDEWNFHEGIDRATVNNDVNAALANRLELQAQALTRKFNKAHGQFLVDSAVEDLGVATDVTKLFNTASKKFLELEVDVPIRAYVSADVYNDIVDLGLTTSAKRSTVSIDDNGVTKFKGFLITEVPDQYLAGAQVIFAPDNIGRTFTGINTARTIESEDFDGVALQGHGKFGQWILEDNKQAVLTAGVSKSTPAK